MAKRSYGSSVVITRKAMDVSDKNLFFKFCIQNLIIGLLLSVIIIVGCAQFSTAYYNENMERVVNETALQLAETQSNTMSSIQRNTTLSMTLASAHEELLQNKAIKDAAVIIYDMSHSKVVASSGPFAVYNNEDLVNWYKEQTVDSDICPTVLPDSLVEFYDTHTNVVIKTMSYLNGSLIPEEVGVKTKNEVLWDELKRADEHRLVYGEDVTFKIIGNRKTDPSFASLTSYAIRIIDKETNEKDIIYDGLQENIKIDTRTFTIGDVEYRMDVAYNYSFAFFAIKYIILFELGLILVCVGLAYLRLREHRNRYN